MRKKGNTLEQILADNIAKNDISTIKHIALLLPVMISLPFKILIFVLVNAFSVSNMVESFK